MYIYIYVYDVYIHMYIYIYVYDVYIYICIWCIYTYVYDVYTGLNLSGVTALWFWQTDRLTDGSIQSEWGCISPGPWPGSWALTRVLGSDPGPGSRALTRSLWVAVCRRCCCEPVFVLLGSAELFSSWTVISRTTIFSLGAHGSPALRGYSITAGFLGTFSGFIRSGSDP